MNLILEYYLKQHKTKTWVLSLLLFFSFETESHIAQAGLQLNRRGWHQCLPSASPVL